MPRIDKYDFVSGGFRAPLAANQAKLTGAIGTATGPLGVGLDANGRVVPGAGVTGIKGVLVTTRDMFAGDIVDVMDAGEITEWGGAAGTNYTANNVTGVISNAAQGAAQKHVGHTVEANRLVCRVAPELTEAVE